LDPHDVIVAPFIKYEKGYLYDSSYFDENENTERQSWNQALCLHPNLNPYDKQIMKFAAKPKHKLVCSPKRNWVYVENGTIRIDQGILKTHGIIRCAYIPLYRDDNDYSVREGQQIYPISDRMPLITDFFKIDCRSQNGAIYSNIHSGISYDSTLKMRHVWNRMPDKSLGYNVLMLGFDSVSRMSWIRMLPKTYEYIVNELGVVVLKGN
jgi:hypothetical protein